MIARAAVKPTLHAAFADTNAPTDLTLAEITQCCRRSLVYVGAHVCEYHRIGWHFIKCVEMRHPDRHISSRQADSRHPCDVISSRGRYRWGKVYSNDFPFATRVILISDYVVLLTKTISPISIYSYFDELEPGFVRRQRSQGGSTPLELSSWKWN